MKIAPYALPLAATAFAAAVLLPARPAPAFSLLGNNLNPNERDVRVFDNFADASANDNVTPAAQFPGETGVELAFWKGIVEWGSLAHGDGSGDSTQPLLGSGGANFDAFWSGSTTSIGGPESNIVSKVASCSSGVLAYCESAFDTGWRIRFCEAWTWSDGPGAIPGGQYDLQGIMAHEYGHALGLGHSTFSDATMFPSVGSGVTSTRSIAPDDIAGVQAIYGVRAGSKPSIVATVASGGTLIVHGTNFTPTANQVWFRPAGTTGEGADPRLIVADLSSNGTVLVAPIPAGAGPGDVIVKVGTPGHSSVSNAFPTDLVGTFGNPPPVTFPDVLDVTPDVIAALIPGTAETITLSGTNLDTVTAVLLDGVAIAPARYTLVNATTITLDMPQASTLGAHTLSVTDGVLADGFPVTVVAPTIPAYQLGTGDFGNVVDRSDGLDIVLAGTPGLTQRLLSSPSNLPSTIPGVISLALGNGFTALVTGGDFVIPASGWLSIHVPTALLVDPGPGGLTFYSQTVDITAPAPFEAGNLQSILLVQ